ncbi:MAG: sulfatase [Pirellulaceae bacterium]|nr:sulfatase [Pirellulaceae bacterium]
MHILSFIVFGLLALSINGIAKDKMPEHSDSRQPNIVIIFIDDMGYGDIGPFGAEGYETPNLDRMAEEGRVFTDFHAATAVCSASRAALMTGCYPERVSIRGALNPKSNHGIAAAETTLAELCKSKGYATACFGKWHLGHHPKFLPIRHGFDEYFGLPYSNDMWPLHPDAVKMSPGAAKRKRSFPPLPLIEGEKVVDGEITAEDQAQLTTWYTERAVDFIKRNKKQPFLLYVPHTMVHVPLFVSDKFKGKSERGLFGDVVMELDWSVGQILQTIEDCGIDERTLVIFTSDNGPWLCYGDHAGSAGLLREGKGTMWEGGYREPTVMRWLGRIPPGTKCDELASTMDILPTVARLIGAELPKHKIDGHDIMPLLAGDASVKTPWDVMYCYYGYELRAVRDSRWKLVFPHAYRTLGGWSGGYGGSPAKCDSVKTGLALYDLKNDIGETTDVKDKHPEIVERLSKAAEAARVDLGDCLTKRKGKNVRPHDVLKPEDKRLEY